MAKETTQAIHPNEDRSPKDEKASQEEQVSVGGGEEEQDPRKEEVQEEASGGDDGPRPRGTHASEGGEGKGEEGENGLTNLRIRRVTALFGSFAGMAGLVYAFGYLAGSAQSGLAGLPLLSQDYRTTLESGALGVVDTISVLFQSDLRSLAIALAIGGAIAYFFLLDRSRRLRRFVASPLACAICQTVLVALWLSSLLGLIEVAKLADTRKRDSVSWEVELKTRKLASETRGGSGVTRWSPVAEAELIARASYPTRGLYRPVRHLFDSRTRNYERLLADGRTHERIQGASASASYFLRRSRTDRENARDLFGWIFFSVLLLIGLSIALTRWRLQLDRNEIEVATTGWDRWLPRTRLSQMSRWILEPWILIFVLLNVALLPVVSGILTQSAIGEEQVSVRLQEACVGKVPSVAAPLNGEGAFEEHFRSRLEELARREAEGEDRDELMQEFEELMEMREAADSEARPGDRPEARLRRCGDELSQKADSLALDIELATRNVLQSRDHSSEEDEALSNYRKAVDQLIDWTLETLCEDGLIAAERSLPAKGLYSLAPKAAEYHLDRWASLQQQIGTTRSGFILRYPRAGNGDSLYLFNALTDWDVVDDSRWLVHVIPESCIAQISVVPDLKTLSLRQWDTGPGKRERRRQVPDEIHPATIEALLDGLAQDRIDTPATGSMITQLGTIIGPLGASNPELLMRSVDTLLEFALDEKQDPSHRSAAMTSLHRTGTPYAAIRFAELSPSFLEEHRQIVGAATTSAGIMAWIYADWRREMNLQVEDVTYQAIGEFLEAVATSPIFDEGIRGAALTSIGRGGYEELSGILEQAVSGSDSFLTGIAVSTLGDLGKEASRETLRGAFADDGLPPVVRRAALSSLYRLGLFGEADLLVHHLLDPHEEPDITSLLLRYLEDVDPAQAALQLVECINDVGNRVVLRRLCSELLGLVDSDFHSEDVARGLAWLVPTDDDGQKLEQALERDVYAEELAVDLCWTVAEFALRGSSEAERLVEESDRCQDVLRELEDTEPPHAGSDAEHSRWHLFIRLAQDSLQANHEDLTGSSAAAFSLPTPSGRQVTIDPQTDSEVLLLDFTASWCGPCVQIAPLLAEIPDRYRDRAFRVVTINEREDAETAQSFAEEHGNALPVLLDLEGEVGELFQVGSLPTLVVIGANGVIRLKTEGVRSIESLDRVLTHEIESALSTAH